MTDLTQPRLTNHDNSTTPPTTVTWNLAKLPLVWTTLVISRVRRDDYHRERFQHVQLLSRLRPFASISWKCSGLSLNSAHSHAVSTSALKKPHPRQSQSILALRIPFQLLLQQTPWVMETARRSLSGFANMPPLSTVRTCSHVHRFQCLRV